MKHTHRAAGILIGMLLLFLVPCFATTASASSYRASNVTTNTFGNLSLAIDEVSDGGTVTVLDPVSKGSSDIYCYMQGSKNVTLDLNGFTLEVNGYKNNVQDVYGIMVLGGTLTIKNGTLRSTTNHTDPVNAIGGTIILGKDLKVESTTSVIQAISGGKVIIDGAEVTCTSSTYAAAFASGGNSAIELRSGSLSQSSGKPVTLSVKDGASATISGGSLYSGTSSAIVTSGTGSLVTISGGTVKNDGTNGTSTGANGYWAVQATEGAKVVQTGGVIESAHGNGLYALSGKLGASVEVSGGTISADGYGVLARGDSQYNATATISDGTIHGAVGAGVSSTGMGGNTLTITGGTIDGKVMRGAGTVAASGGIFTKGIGDDCVVDGYMAVSTNNPNNADEVKVVKVWHATVDPIAKQTYTGSAIVPSVVVKSTEDGSTYAASDYEVTCTNNVNVGTATVTVTCTNGEDKGGVVTSTFEIVKRPVLVRGKDTSKVYGQEDPELGVVGEPVEGEEQSGLASGHTASATVSRAPGEDAGKYDITVSGGVAIHDASGNDVTANYTTTTGKGIFTIEKADPTVVAPTAKEGLVYTGSPHVLIEAGSSPHGTMQYSLDGKEWSTELPTGTHGDTYYVQYRVVGDKNHKDSEPVELAVFIDPAQIIITAHNKSSAYGEDPQELTWEVTGDYVEGDDLGVKLSCEVTKSTPVGQYTIFVTWNDSFDYNAEYCHQGVYTVTKAANPVTASIDGWTYGEARNKPEAEAAFGEPEFLYASSPDGKYTSTVPTQAGTWYLKARVAGSDNWEAGESEPVEFTIAKAKITIAADDKVNTYDEDPLPLTWQVAGDYVEGDELGVSLTCAVTKLSDVGTYPIEVSWNENPNYDAKLVDGAYTVVEADMSLTVSDYHGDYDGKAHGIKVEAHTETEPTVWYATEELNADNYQQAGFTDPVTRTDAGTTTVYYYVVADDYNAVAGAADIVISKEQVTIKAEDKSGAYGSEPLELTYAITADYAEIDKLGVTLSCEVTSSTSVGTYPIKVGWGNDPNYEARLIDGEYDVTKADNSVTASIEGWTYGTAAHEPQAQAAFGEATFSYASSGGAYTKEVPKHAGTWYLKADVAGTDNWEAATSEPVKFVIAPAEITITADDKSNAYGEDPQELTWQVSGGYVEGDELGVSLACSVSKTTPVGTYPIEVSWKANSDYVADLEDGTYTVFNATLPLAVSGYSGTYDGAAHEITVDVPAEVGATVWYATEELDADNYQQAGSTEPVTRTDAGTTTVYYYVVADNYNPAFGSADIAIDPAVVPDPADAERPTANEGLVYDGSAQELVTGPESLPEGLTGIEYAVDDDTWSEELPTGVAAGTYTVRYRYVSDDNHIAPEGGTLDVTIAPAGDGTIGVDIVVHDGAPALDAPNFAGVAPGLLSAEENAALEAGAAARVWLEDTPLARADVPAEDVSLLEDECASLGATAGIWFDLSLYKSVTGFDETAIHQVDTPIELAVSVPDELKNTDATVTRTFYLLRAHKGQAAVLAQGTDEVLEGESDRFSTCLIAYKDVSNPEPTPGKESDQGSKAGTRAKSALPKTGDPAAGAALALPSLATIAAGLLSRRRKH